MSLDTMFTDNFQPTSQYKECFIHHEQTNLQEQITVDTSKLHDRCDKVRDIIENVDMPTEVRLIRIAAEVRSLHIKGEQISITAIQLCNMVGNSANEAHNANRKLDNGIRDKNRSIDNARDLLTTRIELLKENATESLDLTKGKKKAKDFSDNLHYQIECLEEVKKRMEKITNE